MIRLDQVTKRFGAVAALDEADLEARPGEVLALLGPSGCGKTTLLRVVAGFEVPDAGVVHLNGDVMAGPTKWVPPERRNVGMVFQDYALFPHLDVAGNVGYGLKRGPGRRRRVDEVLALVGLEGFGARYPHELSGGQRQRVALARALSPEPAVVLLDEPWSSIDPLLRSAMREELSAILRRAGVTVVLVTHEREEAFALADRVALMQQGRIVQVGPPEETYYAPANRWAAEFVGDANFVPGTLADGVVETPLGRFSTTTAGRGTVDALLRPELVELEPDPEGPAQVVERSFRGHDVFYRVRLSDGRSLCAQRPSTEVVELGERVRVTVHELPVAVFR
jgi:iron(III) transport system ATP-binding protein